MYLQEVKTAPKKKMKVQYKNNIYKKNIYNLRISVKVIV